MRVTIRRAAPMVLIGGVILVISAMALLSHAQVGGMIDAVEDGRYDQMQAIVDVSLREAEGRAIDRAQMIADLPRVKALVAAQDRPGLLAELKPMFDAQHAKYGVEQMMFHVPPGTALLRLQTPEKFGEATKQPMVLEVLKSHVARQGVDIARAGPALFAVVPIDSPDGKPVGSFEVGVNFGAVLDEIKRGYGLDLALYILEEPLHRIATGIDPAIYDEQNRVGQHLRLHATDAALIKGLVDSERLASADVPVHYIARVAGVPYGVLLRPVQDSVGNVIGVIAMVQDFSPSRAAAGRSKIWQALIALFAIIALTGLIIIVLFGAVFRPLRAIVAAFDAQARGDQPVPVVDAAHLGDELAALAAHQARLQAEAAARDGQGGAP
jgi:methyl-accepting chemotaxis protein